LILLFSTSLSLEKLPVKCGLPWAVLGKRNFFSLFQLLWRGWNTVLSKFLN